MWPVKPLQIVNLHVTLRYALFRPIIGDLPIKGSVCPKAS
jgi:hypothetical protein